MERRIDDKANVVKCNTEYKNRKEKLTRDREVVMEELKRLRREICKGRNRKKRKNTKENTNKGKSDSKEVRRTA